MARLKSLPVALDDFADMRAEGRYLYGDKTHQIADMILDSSRRVFLTRPRRFGKTLLVSTLEALFQGQQEMFEGIWTHHRNWDWHAHHYPVLHLNLALAVADRIGRRGHFQPPQSSPPLSRGSRRSGHVDRQR